MTWAGETQTGRGRTLAPLLDVIVKMEEWPRVRTTDGIPDQPWHLDRSRPIFQRLLQEESQTVGVGTLRCHDC